jgi:hypothetical protein
MLTPGTEVDEGRLRFEKCAEDFGLNELNEWMLVLLVLGLGGREAYGVPVRLVGPLSLA